MTEEKIVKEIDAIYETVIQEVTETVDPPRYMEGVLIETATVRLRLRVLAVWKGPVVREVSVYDRAVFRGLCGLEIRAGQGFEGKRFFAALRGGRDGTWTTDLLDAVFAGEAYTNGTLARILGISGPVAKFE